MTASATVGTTIREANAEAVRRMLEAEPVLSDVDFSIAPGEIETSILSPGTEKIVENIPLRRLGHPFGIIEQGLQIANLYQQRG